MDGASWVLIVAVLLYGISVLMLRLILGQSKFVRWPLTWFYASWLVGLTILALPIFRYQEKFSEKSASYLIGALFAFSFGSIVAAFWGKKGNASILLITKRASEREYSTELSRRWMYILLYLGFFGTLLLLVNTVLGGGLSLAERFNADNLGAIREQHMMLAESRIGFLYGPASLMSSIGGLGVAYVCYAIGSRDSGLKRDRWLFRLGLVVLILNIATGFIAFGSRIFAIFAILTAFFGYMEGRWSIGDRVMSGRLSPKGILKLSVSTLLVGAILWAGATVFLEKRVHGQDPQVLLYRTHRASFSPFLYSFTRNDLPTQYLMFSASYLSTPIPTLTFYLDLPDSRTPGPFYGEYNFPAIARWLRRLTFSGDPFAWDRARFEIFKPLGDINFGTNVWSTMLRDLLADFGRLGALGFLGILGFAAQRAYDLQENNPTLRLGAFLAYMRLLLIFAGLISILFLPQFHWALYVSTLALMYRKVRRKTQLLGHRVDRFA